MLRKSYIGVTGLHDISHVEAIRIPPFEHYKVYLGVLVRPKSIEGNPDVGPRFPSAGDVGQIISRIRLLHPQVQPVIHYCPGKSCMLARDARVINQFGAGATQLNFDDLDLVRRYLTKFNPHDVLIFQLNKAFVSDLWWLSSAIGYFAGVMRTYDHLLVDMSGGRGELCDPARFYQIRNAFSRLGFTPQLGIAGGLGPDNIRQLLKTVGPGVSVDAESGLRDAHDNLDVDRVNAYLEEAFAYEQAEIEVPVLVT